jgi:hypothetical protein
METITITLTETQMQGMRYITLSPQDWAENAVTERARKANDEIVQMYIKRALDEGVQIPATRELIVEDAFTRGWVQTAAEMQAAYEAAQAADAEETPE